MRVKLNTQCKLSGLSCWEAVFLSCHQPGVASGSVMRLFCTEKANLGSTQDSQNCIWLLHSAGFLCTHFMINVPTFVKITFGQSRPVRLCISNIKSQIFPCKVLFILQHQNHQHQSQSKDIAFEKMQLVQQPLSLVLAHLVSCKGEQLVDDHMP